MIDSSNNSNKNKKILNKIKNKVQKKGQEEQDFEQTYGKDIQQFLDDSEWDIDSFNKISLSSKDNVSADEDDFGFKVDFKLSAIEQAYIRGANLKISKTVNRNSKGRVMRSMTNITGSKTVKNVNHQNIQQTSSAGIKKGSPLRQLIGLPSKELNTNQEPIVQTKTMIE